MLSDNIRKLRIENNLTQKELADEIHVTSQAVSRWEKGDVEPSVDVISQMAEIFGVTIDEIVGGPEKKPKPQVIKTVEKQVVVEQGKPVLAVCERCNKPIYKGEDIVRVNHTHSVGMRRSTETTTEVRCRSCDTKIKNKLHAMKVENGKSLKVKGFIFGGIFAAIVLLITLLAAPENPYVSKVFLTIFLTVGTFTFTSCMFFKNNFIEDIFETISLWGFVTFPGLITTLDLDGIIWLITVKLAFWILGYILAAAAFLLALVVCLFLSIFVYPFALGIIIKHPEKSEGYFTENMVKV